MDETRIQKIAAALNLPSGSVAATGKLLEEGATVPFIARYRKEATGTLDEVAIAAIRDENERLGILEARGASIKKSLEERKLLTPELESKIDAADTLARLEDIYQPFRPKRKTRGVMAREKGLEPLAKFIVENQSSGCSEIALEFVDPEKGVGSAEEALAGARDIIAENISDSPEARESLRKYFSENAVITSKVLSGKEESGAKYRDYFDKTESVKSIPGHRILAIRRGESEGFLYMKIAPADESLAIAIIEGMFLKSGSGECAKQVKLAVEDSYKRLLAPSTEVFVRLELKRRADEEAVKVFSDNLRELLMASPLGRKNVLAIDPGFRTGCKLACLDRQGALLFHDVIFPERGGASEARTKVLSYCEKFSIEAIAVGNGTAGRETESFLKGLGLKIPVVMVNESGASIYSASEVAREEFPDQDITVRGAVSIGRRLMDPLAELVKIDPQSIGVGQYQHDVNQVLLKKSLDDVVVSCVNSVGVEVNTASKQLLSYVAGLNSSVAANIVEYRNLNGPFKSRRELLKVKGLGAKTYEQAAGFLRIRDGVNPLDASAVHPERYELVEKMASDIGANVPELLENASVRAKIDLKKYVGGDIGLPTLNDIMSELGRPGRDPRKKFETFSFAEGVEKIEDLKEGMSLPGIVTNVTAFGAFVDIGVHQDGLVHVSELSDSFVKDPRDVVKPQQKVNVRVLEVDIPRKRISLTMRSSLQKRAKGAGEMSDKKSGKFPVRPRKNEPFGNSFGDAFGKLGAGPSKGKF